MSFSCWKILYQLLLEYTGSCHPFRCLMLALPGYKSQNVPDSTGEGGLQRWIKAHKHSLSQGSEASLRSYSARHMLPTPIISGLGVANNALYCHVMLSQDTDKFRKSGQQPGRDALGFHVLIHAFDVTAGAG